MIRGLPARLIYGGLLPRQLSQLIIFFIDSALRGESLSASANNDTRSHVMETLKTIAGAIIAGAFMYAFILFFLIIA